MYWVTFQASHDAFAVYVTPGIRERRNTLVNQGSGLRMDENYWTDRVRGAVPAVHLQRRDEPGVHLRPDRRGQQYVIRSSP